MLFEFYEKRRLKRVLYSRPILIGCAMVVLMATVPVYNVYTKFVLTFERKHAAAEELSRLTYRETVLRDEIERLATPLGREAEIRQKFELGREGERLIVLVEEPEQESVPEETEEPKRSFLRSLMPF